VSFQKGSRILVLGDPENGWFQGRLEDTYEEGLFPSSYTVAETAALSTSSDALKNKKEEEDVLTVCKCLKDYTGKAGELSFKEHDRIEVLDQSNAAAWRCRFKGKIGTVSPTLLEEDKVLKGKQMKLLLFLMKTHKKHRVIRFARQLRQNKLLAISSRTVV
jgi:hypothetical protein